jgi:signal transduction histidine kinase
MLNNREDKLGDILTRAIAATERHDTPPIVIERDEAAEAIALYTDSDRLTQVFINLISNAQKYCDAEQPRLSIQVKSVGGQHVVDFVDNGLEIPSDVQSVLFEKFSRGTDHRAAGGAGLGLAICREVMHRLGGSIAYLPGQGGAAFRVTLPKTVAEAA